MAPLANPGRAHACLCSSHRAAQRAVCVKGVEKIWKRLPHALRLWRKKCSGACLILPEPNLKKGFMKEMVFSFLFEKEK